MDLLDITKDPQTNNTGGLYEDFYFARTADILTWPTKEASTPTPLPSDSIILTDVFIMKTGKKFFHAKTVLGNAEVKWEVIGPRKGKCYKHSFEVFLPQNTNDNLGVLSLMKNDELVVIAKDRNGILRVVGSELMPATLDSGNGTTGKKAEDDPGAGNTLVFTTEDNDPPATYAGEIPLTPAVAP